MFSRFFCLASFIACSLALTLLLGGLDFCASVLNLRGCNGAKGFPYMGMSQARAD